MSLIAVGALLIYFGRIIRLPRINQIVILLTLSILLPPVSGDYTLVHLYPGWLLLRFSRSRWNRVSFAPACCLAVFSYWHLSSVLRHTSSLATMRTLPAR